LVEGITNRTVRKSVERRITLSKKEKKKVAQNYLQHRNNPNTTGKTASHKKHKE
jgi:hypothetical protein